MYALIKQACWIGSDTFGKDIANIIYDIYAKLVVQAFKKYHRCPIYVITDTSNLDDFCATRFCLRYVTRKMRVRPIKATGYPDCILCNICFNERYGIVYDFDIIR